jgi:AAA+ superfamily predicted ATPase
MLGHYAFTGNPGTGKTTAGKIFASALYAMGALKTANFNKISAKDLIAGYVGQTSIKTAEMLKSALNGVLLIDEAYALASDPDSHGTGDSFKEDAVNEILQFMEDNVNNSCIIFAGYTDEIERLKKSNSGFESRIGTTIEFHDYSVDECVQILRKDCEKEEYTISDGAVERFRELIEAEKKKENFGNARTVRNIFNNLVKNQNLRIVYSGDRYDMNSDEINMITEEDFKN